LSDVISFKLCSKQCHLEDKDATFYCCNGEKRKRDKSEQGVKESQKRGEEWR
jgi:hypothetical protein